MNQSDASVGERTWRDEAQAHFLEIYVDIIDGDRSIAILVELFVHRVHLLRILNR